MGSVGAGVWINEVGMRNDRASVPFVKIDYVDSAGAGISIGVCQGTQAKGKRENDLGQNFHVRWRR